MSFDRQLQIGYFSYCLRQLPGAYGKLDTNRLTLAHFCVHALDLLGVWDQQAADVQRALGLNKAGIIEWIYALQVVSDLKGHAGFKGGTFLGGSFPRDNPEEEDDSTGDPLGDQNWQLLNQGHIAMTYTALCTLCALGDDLSRVDKASIIQALQALQLTDGSFQCVAVGSEHDLRFLYCARRLAKLP